jgi:pimeloyl-ACP methyl ester carboxylesterase
MEKPTQLTVANTQVLIDGDGPHTLLMLHGWPDTHRLWDKTVEALKPQFRCVRLTLPGFDVALPARATSLNEMSDILHAVVETVSPSQPVTLVLHDWGCIFGYEFAARHPDQVAGIAAVDIGDHNAGTYLKSLSGKAKWLIFSYQAWLALAWLMGKHVHSGLGDHMTRSMAKTMRCPTPPEHIGWKQNYPYSMQWFGLAGGFKAAAKVQPACPVLYFYGQRKPFQFQSKRWLDRIGDQQGSAVKPFATGHWVMCQEPDEFNATLLAWLNKQAFKTKTNSDPLAG